MRLLELVLACAAGAALLAMVAPRASADQAAPTIVDPRMVEDDDAFMNRQDAALLHDVDVTLDRVKPSPKEPWERRLALDVLDGVLHEAYAPARPPVQRFFHERFERAVREIEKTKVRTGARIWKLYNMGFVVRTRTVTLAFDINLGARGFRLNVPGKGAEHVKTPGFPVPAVWAERLAKQCDVLFISHKHEDHADPVVARAFLDQGKPVVGPIDVFAGTDLQPRLTHLERNANKVQTLPIRGGKLKLRLVVYPGQQYQGSGVLNNVVLVMTPDGLSIAHDGDQEDDPYPQYQEDFKWIDRVHKQHKVDVLMTNAWTNDILRIARGFNPKLVLTGHEVEMGHPLWDRLPYWGDEKYLVLNVSAMRRAYPTITLAWGESCRYLPPKKR